MLNIRGVYEVAIKVRNLARSEPFYKQVLELEEGLRDQKRPWLFLRVGGPAGMIVLQEDESDWPIQHFAFAVDRADIDKAADLLRAKGIDVEGPIFHEWMPAYSIYFSDPDGHSLELCAPVV